MKSLALYLLSLLVLLSPALAEPGLKIQTSLQQSVDPLPFGTPATLVLKLSWDEKWPFEPPAADALKLGDLTIIDAYATDESAANSERKELSYHLVFTKFEPGKSIIPAVQFSTPLGTVKSDALAITFSGSKPLASDKPGELRSPKDAITLSSRDFWIWLVKAIALSLLAILALIFLGLRIGRLSKWLSPVSRAKRQLNKLNKKLDSGLVSSNEGVLELVEVLRIYLQRAYGLVTREATSKEISHQLTMDNRCANIKPIANDLLKQGDQAKFAASKTTISQAKDLLQQLSTALSSEKKKGSNG